MAHLASILNIQETLFTTNQVPSEADSKVIEVKLAQLREERSRLAARLAETEATIAHLKAIQHPIRYIPDDVLGRIFEYATPWCFGDGTERDSFPPIPLKLDAPWTLSHVCRNWRAVCLSLPQLWSAFWVLWGEPGTTEWVERLDTLYPRSEPLLLRLYADYISEACLPTLLESAHRWRCIRLHIDWNMNSDDDVVLHDCLFPHLTHLALRQTGRNREFPKIVAPCLQNLELVDAWIPYRCLLPWDQITQYKSTNTDHDLIGLMKNLEEIVIEDNSTFCRWHNLDTRNVVSMNSVRRLEYTDTNTDDDEEIGHGSCYTKLFTHYQFTSLRTLVITDAFPEGAGFAFTLPSVIELSLSFQKPYTIRGILYATPNMQSLHLRVESDAQIWLMNYTHPALQQRPPVAHLRQLRHLLLTLMEGPPLVVFALGRAITDLKVDYELPLETVSFYSGILGEEKTRAPKSQWVKNLQEEIPDDVDVWTARGIQVQYHYNVQHRFAE
ncbi:hypothetical protein CYLTODRAFT_424170 [Cylindrobasidium torrendii FP15055 ss-10]|uniref:Uncharacterized protein n=1 Tax=Cylindrobasidium torrendii FP15055 ss-10 TaxID=1314674 RepID=A0A0D7B501_9AGAR|nr:hypothetical protein CYLTODRAFT_424170 [Cylindrobasidium torrendii FP15055 ss-10]